MKKAIFLNVIDRINIQEKSTKFFVRVFQTPMKLVGDKSSVASTSITK